MSSQTQVSASEQEAIHKLCLFFALTESEDDRVLALSSRALDFFDQTDRSLQLEDRILSVLFKVDQKRDEICRELKDHARVKGDLFEQPLAPLLSWRRRSKELKPDDARAAVLAFVLKFPQQKIARWWRISEGSLRVRLNRALLQLAEANP